MHVEKAELEEVYSKVRISPPPSHSLDPRYPLSDGGCCYSYYSMEPGRRRDSCDGMVVGTRERKCDVVLRPLLAVLLILREGSASYYKTKTRRRSPSCQRRLEFDALDSVGKRDHCVVVVVVVVVVAAQDREDHPDLDLDLVPSVPSFPWELHHAYLLVYVNLLSSGRGAGNFSSRSSAWARKCPQSS